MHRPALLLVVLGLVLGPLYYGWCEYGSGQETARFELTERAARWTLPDGSIQRFGGHLTYRPVMIEVTPEHNDVRLRLMFHAAPGATAGENRYLATLFDGDQPRLQRELAVSLSGGATRTVTLTAFPVYTPAEHLFVLEETAPPATEVASVTLTVMQDVERLVAQLAWGGVAMLMAGLGLLAYAAVARGRR
jgi:hypothetical protein